MGETITFETLYSMVRKEKTENALQELTPESYTQIANYLKTKIEIHKNQTNPSEAEKIKIQIISARKLIKELYERRERKIMRLAINKSRTKAEIIDPGLLKPEIAIAEEITKILNNYREKILLKLVNAKIPFLSETTEKTIAENSLLIRFTKPVPKFVGENLEVYGPFEEGNTTTLPKAFAELLIKREHAEEIKQSQAS